MKDFLPYNYYLRVYCTIFKNKVITVVDYCLITILNRLQINKTCISKILTDILLDKVEQSIMQEYIIHVTLKRIVH